MEVKNQKNQKNQKNKLDFININIKYICIKYI